MKCINWRFGYALIISVLLSACANKGVDQTADEVSAEQSIQQQYQQVIAEMKSLEGQAKQANKAGIFKGNEALESSHEVLMKIHEHKPFYPGPMLNLGISAWWLGDIAGAQSYLEGLLNLESSLAEAVSKKSISEQVRNDIVDNIEMFTLPAFNYLGLISRELGEFENAEGYYRKALSLDDENLTAIRNLAILLDLYKGQFADALPLYEQYQSLLDEPDSQVKDWIFDLKNRL